MARTTPLRAAFAIVGILAPPIMLAGLGTDIHEAAWYIWYGWNGSDLPWSTAAGDVPFWLGWGLVAPLAWLGWSRSAAVAAWSITGAMVGALATGGMLPTESTGAWLALAGLGAIALTFSPRHARGRTYVGKRPMLLVLATVASVLFARLLGHHFVAVSVVAYFCLGVAIVHACRPTTLPGRRALLLLGLPALSAICSLVTAEVFSFYVAFFSPATPWPLTVLTFYGLPTFILSALGTLLRRYERSVSTECRNNS